MKLKYKIVLLPFLSVFALIASIVVLLLLQQRRLSEQIPADVVFQSVFWWTVLIGVAILGVSTISAWLIAGKLSDPIAKFTAIAREIASGDLSSAATSVYALIRAKRVDAQKPSNDETWQLLQAIKAMTQNLNSLVGQVQRSGIQVASSTKELSASAKQQEMTLNTQMDSMNNVQKSVEQISTITSNLVDTMHHVAVMSQETTGVANSGQTDLLRMADVMRHLGDVSTSISEKLESINHKAENITSVITLITKVADQTNLLSLNAAIEAEKAGEYGRGFSVVSREIRRLADQTAVAALDIEEMVKEMQTAVSAGVEEIDKFIVDVQNGVKNVGNIGERLAQIIQQVQALLPNFDHATTSMEQQSHNAQQINSTMVELGQDMRQTMNSLRESYLAIAQLDEAAKRLQDEVSCFEVSFTILKEIDIFRPFSNEAIAHLNQQMRSRHFGAGETIIQQGDQGDSLFIIAKGVVKVWVRLEAGKSLDVAQLSAGDVFGEMAFLTGEVRTANLTCVTDTYIFEITKADIAPFIEKQPEIIERLSEILTERKVATESRKSSYQTHKIDRDVFHRQTLSKIRNFFGLTK